MTDAAAHQGIDAAEIRMRRVSVDALARPVSIFSHYKPIALIERGAIMIEGEIPSEAPGTVEVVFPALFRFKDVCAIPYDWSFLAPDNNLICYGTAVNPRLVVKGDSNNITVVDDKLLRVTMDATVISEAVFFVGGFHFGNYYHTIIDYFPKILSAAQFSRKRQKISVVLSNENQDLTRELLVLAGIDENDVIWVGRDEGIFLRDAYLISNFSQYGYIHQSAITLLKRAFGLDGLAGGRRRLYLSRRDAKSRRVLNELELSELLERYGFETVTTAGMTLAQQRELFTEAAMVVGPHGAGLTNMLFAPPGARVLELHPFCIKMAFFEQLAQLLGHHHRFLVATWDATQLPNEAGSDFTVDLDAVETALSQWGLQAP